MIRKVLLMAAIGLAGVIVGCDIAGGRMGAGGNSFSLEQAGHLLNAGGHLFNAATLGEKDEDAIGQSVAVSLSNRYQLSSDERLQRYVNLVGLTVADASPNAGGNWVFGVLETPEVNAFSGPNGYVFVTRGALMHMQNEAELAGVLAHEISHVCSHDGLNQVKAAEQRGALSEGIKAADQRTAQFGAFADEGVNIVTAEGYTKPQEFAADQHGVEIMAAAGYDPSSYLHFLQGLQNGGGGASGGQLMGTHPGLNERVANVAKQVSGMRPGGATLQQRFANNTGNAR